METLRSKIEKSDKVRVLGALEGFTVTSPVSGVYHVSTQPNASVSERSLDDVMNRINEMRDITDVKIEEFDFSSNEWVKI